MLIVTKNVVPTNVIDSWNQAAELIEHEPGMTADSKNPDKFIHDDSVRYCESRMILFDKHRRLYSDILNRLYPYVDYYQYDFNVTLYKRLEIQHTTYHQGGHYIKHTDGSVVVRRSLQRKISMILMLSDKNEYEGGSLVINNKDIEMDKGTMVLFSPTNVHHVTKVESGVRKTLVVWALGPHWN